MAGLTALVIDTQKHQLHYVLTLYCILLTSRKGAKQSYHSDQIVIYFKNISEGYSKHHTICRTVMILHIFSFIDILNFIHAEKYQGL